MVCDIKNKKCSGHVIPENGCEILYISLNTWQSECVLLFLEMLRIGL